jgi:Protein of unknown function (DUF3102)
MSARTTNTLAEHAEAIRGLHEQTVENIVEIGRRLSECRSILKRDGKWQAWLKAEFGWSERAAYNYIGLYDLAKADLQRIASSDLPLSALYLIAAPSTPESARDAVLDLAANGEKLTQEQVKEAIDEAKARKKPKKKPPKEPPRAEVAKLVRAWVQASPEAKRQFVRERWDEIARARKQLDANGAAAQDRWIEGDAGL